MDNTTQPSERGIGFAAKFMRPAAYWLSFKFEMLAEWLDDWARRRSPPMPPFDEMVREYLRSDEAYNNLVKNNAFLSRIKGRT